MKFSDVFSEIEFEIRNLDTLRSPRSRKVGRREGEEAPDPPFPQRHQLNHSVWTKSLCEKSRNQARGSCHPGERESGHRGAGHLTESQVAGGIQSVFREFGNKGKESAL